ncbi:MAG: ArsR family transcriptional regulator, nickel/cobalt-responsive transcriptional repressor [Thermoleophilaceae bacterium]|jgi:prepilin-type processing-associated H-X9-DG protein|nr:ArsR family transcriptional regulator, nickel/cobalt-responsive transcriptional repressor [Thermoleophilaceae bacterium]
MSHGVNRKAPRTRIDAALAGEVAEQMQALGTASRLRILASLRAGPLSVGDLAAEVEMEQSAVSHQLRVLRHLGWVVGERHGRRIVYALHDGHVAEMVDQAVFHIEHLRLAAARPRRVKEAS